MHTLSACFIIALMIQKGFYMHRQKWIMLWINILGGIVVIGSYILCLKSHPGQVDALWGQVPQNIRSLSTGNMPLAALGYFAFTLFILFGLNPDETKIYNRRGFGFYNILYTAILLPSALWMPMTFAVIDHFNPALWFADRLVLWIVGLSSFFMLAELLGLRSRQPVWAYWLAVVGCVMFCIQTIFMDAIFWNAFFIR